MSSLLIASNAVAKNDEIDNANGVISGNGVLDNGGVYRVIGTVGEDSVISVANNGSITVNHNGGTPPVMAWGEFESGDMLMTSGTVYVANSGTINLGSGSIINTNYGDLIEGTLPNRPDILLETDYQFAFGVGIVEAGGTSAAYRAKEGKLIADNLTVNMTHQRDDKFVVGIHGAKDAATMNFTGLTTINTTALGDKSLALGIYAKNGTLVTADDLLVTSKGQQYAVGLSSQSEEDNARSLISYNNAVITSVADDFADGISTAGGHVVAQGDTQIDITINNTGGVTSGIWVSDGIDAVDLDSYFTANGKTSIALKAGADATELRGAESVGSSDLTTKDLTIAMDTQGHQQTQGTGLFASTDLAPTAGNITVNGKLNIDVADTTRSGTWHYIHANKGGNIALNGDVNLGVNYNDPDATAILVENADSHVAVAGQKMQVVGTVEAKDAGQVDLSAVNASRFDGGFLTGTGGINNLSLAEDSVWNMTKDSQLTNLTLNASTLNFMHTAAQTQRQTRDAATFKTLTVDGDYAGNNGNLVMNTQLGDDNSATDRMIVNGDTSGTTNVKVLNAGGAGGLTTNGIELITVNGNSAGEFKQNGRIVAGAYDYTLQRGAGQNATNWYLSSALSPVTPVDPEQPVPVDPQDPTKPVPQNPVTPTPQPAAEHAVRPEAGLYGVNLAAANTLFNTRLHDRLGETHYVDALTGKESVTSLWLRNVGGHTRQHDSSDQLSMQSNRYVMQLGGDVAQWSSNKADRYHVGVMGGYANQKSRAENQRNGNRATGSIDGYSVGVYGTWLQDNESKEGAYVDTWVQYNWFDNTISGDDVATENYKSTGFTASVESGYTWKLADISERSALYIQPKAQVTWMGVKADSHKEANGTRVEGDGDGNIQTRVGVRLYGHAHNKLDDGKDRAFQPFVEANWIHNTKDFGASLNGENMNLAGSNNIGELKAGVEGQLTKNVTLWGNVAQQLGTKGYSDTQGMLGVKYSW
ncbi:autotransporter outer membrane beta-barrel domain-containing protein [Trabulsiella odontotermitis]|uniref:autotransporter outer membrane beta-barrel domain-containing protein n=1 Tax=Trabulsiella odontotermitis TaxID=379893 RepID=UPI000675F370|nr:autotransporter outer membrane beta-barrel domain-containing protein [Trabulsiella odontotermitis]